VAFVETVEVSQPYLQEVIPLGSRAYRATGVNEVKWEQIARGKEGLGVTWGVDVGKFDVLVVCRWANGHFERPWRVKNPREISTLAALAQRVHAERKLAVAMDQELMKAIADGSSDEYEAWRQRALAIQESTEPDKTFLVGPSVVEKAQGYEVNRALVEAGMSVAASGVGGLDAYPDPSTGQPFTYREFPGGFELESAYEIKGQPLKFFFPQAAGRR